MIALSRLLKLQSLYAVLGVLFNVVSLILISQGGEPLTPNQPIQGLVVMTIYGLMLISGFLNKETIYKAFMVLAVLLLGYGGVFNHLNFLRESPELYHSVAAGVIGVGINIFGLILNIIAALGKYKK